MKKLSEYITINESGSYDLRPVNKEELKELIDQLIEERGPKCDLNDIDVSRVKDMSNLFENSEFNGDISKWDVSRVVDMRYMFWNSKFVGDVSKWDVSKVKYMNRAFDELLTKAPNWYGRWTVKSDI